VAEPDKKPIENEPSLLLNRFLQKAKPILAAERGLNARSRAKLKRLADENHVSDEMFDRALVLIKNGDASASELTRYERSFVKFLRRELKELPANILPARLEQKAITIALDKYQIESQRARDLIQLVADELELSRISRTDTERHIAELVSNLIGNAPYVSENIRERLYLAGDQWGMERGYLDSVIIAKLSSNRASTRKRSTSLAWLPLILTMIVAAGGIAGVIVWLSQDVNNPRIVDSTTQTPADVPLIDRLPKWWSEDAKLKYVTTRHAIPVLDGELEQLISDNASTRALAYQVIIDQFVTGNKIAQHRADVAYLLGYWYAADPSDLSAEMWLNHVCSIIEFPPGKLPISIVACEQSLAANQLLARAASVDQISDARMKKIDEKSIPLVGWSVSDAGAGYLSSSTDSIIRDCWNHLILNARTDVPQAIRMFEHLSLSTKSALDSDTHSQFQVRLIESILESNPRFFGNLKDYIRDLIARAPAYQLASIARQLRKIPSDDDRQWLIDRFKERIKMSAVQSQAMTIDMIEEHFGVIPAELIRYRSVQRKWNQLIASQELAEFTQIPTEPNPVQIAMIAHLNTIGWLVHMNIDSPALDNKLDKASIDLERIGALESIHSYAPFQQSSLRVSNTDQQMLRRYLSELKFTANSNASNRASAFKKLSDLAPKFRDLDANQARVIVDYVLSESPGLQESVSVQTNLANFSHMPGVLIALNDKLTDPEVTFAKATSSIQELTNDRIIIPVEDEYWRIKAQSLLCKYIAEGLRHKSVTAEPSHWVQWRGLELFMAEQIRQRAQLLIDDPNAVDQLNDADLSDLSSFSNELENLLVRFSDQMEHRQMVQRRKIAGEALTEDSLAKTMLLAQWSVELLYQRISVAHPELKEPLDNVMSEFNSANRIAVSLAQQLYLCEFAQFKMLQIAGESR
jgi:hypothetical protein